MRLKSIITDLSKFTERVDEAVLANEEQLAKDIKSIKNVLYAKKDLVALAAPQLGINARIICIKFANGDIRTFINPMIVKTEGMHLSRESNPSIPDKEFIVMRANDIHVTYQTPVGVIETNLFKEAPSEVFQQLCHLLDGIMLTDYGLEVLEGWDEAPQEERDAVLDMYFKHLSDYNETLHQEIESDDNLKKMNDAIDFMTGVATGEIEIMTEEKPKRKLNYKQRRELKKVEKRLKRKGLLVENQVETKDLEV
jgi:peptide deformylase